MSRIAIILISILSAFAQEISPQQWDLANSQVRRLPPSAFAQLPTPIQAELQRRRCTIPQVPMIETPHNVIQGEFAKPGQTDWAVLCSTGRVTSILVFWNGSALNPVEIAKANDLDRLQGWGGEKIVYDWVISPVDRKFIMQHYTAYGGEKPPPIDHQGVEDAIYGKGSSVLYFYRGKWLHLTGAD